MTTYQGIGTLLATSDGPDTQSLSQCLPSTDPGYLAPEDAFNAHSTRRLRDKETHGRVNGGYTAADSTSARSGGKIRRRRDKERGRSGSRRNSGVWKKLLWVKQSCMHVPNMSSIVL